MFFNTCDTRRPLKEQDVVEMASGERYVIDQFLAGGGFSLMYIAHRENTGRYVALKELYPQNLQNAIAERQDDGRITIYNPLTETGDCNDITLWNEARNYFEREAQLTAKAGAAFDRNGKREKQNAPDVLQVEGPLSDIHGNVYLVVDTYQGESLRAFIERGFVKGEEGTVLSNQHLFELLDVLIKTTSRLSHLHGDCKLYHLDLSPDNIYLVKAAGGTTLEPHIIDYGSAYEYHPNDPCCAVKHRYTCNLHSAPEVLALAELQDPDCGYHVDPSSDTYSLVSILFYAVTGRIFSPALRMYDSEWKEQIHSVYSTGLPAGQNSFAGELISFFTQGLASDQQDRFPSAKALCDKLRSLKRQYQAFGNLLPLVEPDELMSYMVLDKHPLYQYQGADGNLHILCLGCGVFVKRMILSLISCGQMIGAHLNIHIVAADPERKLKEYLLTKAKGLERFSNLTSMGREPGRTGDTEYVTFTYDRVPDLLTEEACRRILAEYQNSHYIIISLGANNTNIDAANLFARGLAERENPSQKKTIINYYCSEDAANNTRATVEAGELPVWIQIDAFGSQLSSYGRVLNQLGRRTLRIAHLYNKIGEPRISLAESARRLIGEAYDQRSSCAAALHLKYKLASVGINPSPSTNKRTIAAAYQKALSGSGFGALMELEHRRWMMYMTADGYVLPTQQELERYGFEMCDKEFNGMWKCPAKRLHPCLVPCSPVGISLTQLVWNRFFRGETDRRTIETAIKESEFDELDKMSLKLHLLAGKKCERILRTGRIDGAFREIAFRLQDAAQQAREDYAEGSLADDLSGLFGKLRSMLDSTQKQVSSATKNLSVGGSLSGLKELQLAFDSAGINISAEIEQLNHCLSVFAEYAANKDYKAPDAMLINHLLWILYAEDTLTLIKLRGRTIAENITGPLVLEPQKLVFFGLHEQPEWVGFLRGHGFLGQIGFRPCTNGSVEEIICSLETLIKEHRKKCVLDISGADEVMVVAAQRIAAKYDNVGVMRSRPDGSIENIGGFPLAPAYSLTTTVAADEIYSLYGAKELPTENRYMEHLQELVPTLWKFYNEFRDDWEMISAFFAHPKTSGSDIWITDCKIDENTCWKPYTRIIEKIRWEALELPAVFDQMAGAGFIRDLRIDEPAPGKLSVTFRYPAPSESSERDYIFKCFNTFFSYRVPITFAPFHCRISKSSENMYNVDVRCGCVTSFYETETTFSDKRKQSAGGGKRYPCSGVVPALKRMEQLGLIFDLKTELADDHTTIKFLHSNPAISDCLATAGNILEMYVWDAAKRTREFDDCKANLHFAWSEGISNELDVILTKGLTSLVISCKTAKFNKEHLYEIKYLTDRFSLNSKPVIVYSSDKAFEGGHITEDLQPVKDRARAMGIYLIDLNDLNDPAFSLGEKLVRIMNGLDNP